MDFPEMSHPAPVVSSPSAGKHRLRWGLLVIGALLGAIVVWRIVQKPGQEGGKAGGDRAVAVKTVPVARRDVPVQLDGLGSVVPLSTVILRSRVDGQLQGVSFTEGQHVKANDVLAQIDPRPFRIQ